MGRLDARLFSRCYDYGVCKNFNIHFEVLRR